MITGRCECIVEDEYAQDADDTVGKLSDVVQDAATRLHQVSPPSLLLSFSSDPFV